MAITFAPRQSLSCMSFDLLYTYPVLVLVFAYGSLRYQIKNPGAAWSLPCGHVTTPRTSPRLAVG